MLELRNGIVKYGRNEVVRGVSLEVRPGQTVGLVGESGSGKSTIAKALVGINPLSDGQIYLDDTVLADGSARGARAAKRSVQAPARHGIQMVFQDPRSSLNPRMSIAESLTEAVRVLPAEVALGPAQTVEDRVTELIELVGLGVSHLNRYPHQFSGGQLQRIAIARMLAVRPSYMLLDEVTASLDVSVQARILNLLRQLQRTEGFAVLYISHDLSVVRYLCDYIYVMRNGEIAEQGEINEVFSQPRTEYTKALLESVPQLDGRRWRDDQPAGSTR